MTAWGGTFGPHPRARWSGRLALLAAAVVALFAVGALRLPDWLPQLANPFATKTIDRSQPALLKSLEDLSEYRAATGHFEVIVDVEKDAKYVPDFIRGERTLFVAAGTVDGVVDFNSITAEKLTISADRRTVDVLLPHARLGTVRVDPAASYVFAKQRGALDRIGGVFSDNPTSEGRFYQLAEEKMRAAAAADGSGIVQRSEDNTRAMLTSMLRSLGFTTVTVTFEDAPVA
jgi:hypothetical protein